MNKLIIISGPTACMKTQYSLEIAQKYQAEIINFDSLLFYRELNIGTAKPTKSQRKNIPHHLIDFCSIKNPLNAYDFQKIALEKIKDLHQNKKMPILVGGSGFYLKALLFGMYESQTTPKEILDKSKEVYQKKGIPVFLEILKNEDPVYYSQVHPNDHYRVRRAVEHYWTTGQPFSLAMNQKTKNTSPLKDNEYGWDSSHVYLDIEKSLHWELIEKRTQSILDLGLEQEVRDLLNAGYSGKEKPMQSIGYKQMVDFCKGGIKTQDECFEKIVFATRQLAKAQRTWFAKVEHKIQFDPTSEHEKIFLHISNFLTL